MDQHLKKEVFLTPFYDKIVSGRLVGKCYVMFLQDFVKYKPKTFADHDVFVCESRYLGRILHFKKLKQWPLDDDGVEFEERSKALTLSRVPSVFAGTKPSPAKDDAAKTDNDDDEHHQPEELTPIDKHRIEVECSSSAEENKDEKKYYEQLHHNDLWLKLGDGVFVSTESKPLPDILRVDRLWRTNQGEAFLSGAWFARPSELSHEPTRMFYKNELFGTHGLNDRTVPLSQVLARCEILSMKDFTTYRPTEVDENRIFLCQFKVQAGCDVSSNATEADDAEDSQQASLSSTVPQGSLEPMDTVQSPPPSGAALMSESTAKKVKCLRSYKLSHDVLDDELYYFRKPITPATEASPLLMSADTSVELDSVSLAGESVAESGVDSEMGVDMDTSSKSFQTWLAAQPKLNSRSKSGYILFSAEVRKRIMKQHPDAAFGDISRMVGLEWKKRSEEDKKRYEQRAAMIALEREKTDKLAGPPAAARCQPGQIKVYVCRWKDCDHQYESPEHLLEHLTTGHTSQIIESGENQYVCLWVTCTKYRKEGKPFPSLPRLQRHIKEKHMTTALKCIFPNQKSKNYFPMITELPGPPPPHPHHYQQQYGATGQMPPPPPAQYPMPVQGTTQQQQQQQQQALYYQAQQHSQHYTPQQQSLHIPNAAQTTQSMDSYGQAAALSHTPQSTAQHQLHPHTPQQFQQVGYQQSAQQPSQTTVTSQVGHYAPPPTDPGRTIVQASKPAEPVFVAPAQSQRIQRVLHTETYLRYIESLSSEQQSVSKWDQVLGAGAHNTTAPREKKIPYHWLGDTGANKEQVIQALWNLRKHMLDDSLRISRWLDD